jgi:hypothetical protein
MQYKIGELRVGGIIDHSIQLIRNHFWILFRVAFLFHLPAILLLVLLSRRFGLEPWGGLASSGESGRTVIYEFIFFHLLFRVCVYPIGNAAMIHAVTKSYLGESVTVSSAFSRSLQAYVPLVLTGVLKLAIIGVLTFVFLLPFSNVMDSASPLGASFVISGLLFLELYLIMMFLLTNQVVVVEGVWGFSALKRSWFLMRKQWGGAFAIFLIFVVIWYPVTVVNMLGGGHWFGLIVAVLLRGLLSLLIAAMMVALYFSARCKHEQFDLERLAQGVSDSVAAREAEQYEG